MLDTELPFTLIEATVFPGHFSFAMTLIFEIFAFIDVSTGPLIDTISMLNIILILAFVLVAVSDLLLFSPSTFAMFHSVTEFTFVELTIWPSVGAFSVGLAIFVFTCVYFSSIGE
jgi:hypothetical protein